MRNTGDNRLPVLAAEINEHDTSKRACEVKSMMHGYRVGQLLLEAKKLVPHGAFLDWVAANTSVTPRMCQNYMAVAGDPRLAWAIEREYETVSHLTLTKAVKLARDHKAIERWAKKISVTWAAASEIRRKFVGCLGEARESFKDAGGDEAFKPWLVENAPIGPEFADKIPELLGAEYDDEAWTDAMLADIVASLSEGSL